MGSPWRDAGTIAEIGQVMARWLTGEVRGWSGHGDGVDPETRHLLPTLVALNRAGVVTTNSQPGEVGTGYDGAHWRQKAFAAVIVDDRSPLLDRLIRSANSSGLTVLRGNRYPGLTVLTDRNGEPQMALAGSVPRNHLAREWSCLGSQGLKELRDHGAVLHVVDPVWGRDDRLWPALTSAIR
ncbi:DUF6919 domain-containing protein [Streptomyces lavendulae]|uniref:DUF6919 domain-containing protein n=1 Tax=Streptomyces lavendulae TaxID=1914 RepID=UPI003382839E